MLLVVQYKLLIFNILQDSVTTKTVRENFKFPICLVYERTYISIEYVFLNKTNQMSY